MLKIILTFTFSALTVGLQGCGQGCTEIGCSDQLSGTIKTADGTWPEGTYTSVITTEKGSYTCTLDVPADLGEIGQASCVPEGGWSMWVEQDSDCTEEVDEDSATSHCTPIPDHYTVHFAIDDTPGAVTVQIERDGVVLGDEDFSPEYEKSQPNGKGCPPVCRQAHVAIQLS